MLSDMEGRQKQYWNLAGKWGGKYEANESPRLVPRHSSKEQQ